MPVINIKDAPDGWQADQRYVYIGRPGSGLGGPFGNPFRIGPDGDRLEVLARFDLWLRGRIVADPEFAEKVKQLHNKVLVCFCYPKKCHGEILEHVAKSLCNGTFFNK